MAVEGSAAVKKSFDNNKLQLDKQKRSPVTKFCFIAKQYFNCRINQSDYSFFLQLEPNEKPNEFLFGQETKKRSFFPPDRLATFIVTVPDLALKSGRMIWEPNWRPPNWGISSKFDTARFGIVLD